MLSGIYIYIYIRYKSNGGLGSLPAAYRFLFQLSFLPTFPIVRRKYRIENWFLTRPTLLPPTPPIYKENGGLTFHSWTVHIYIYICFLVLLLLLRSLFTAQRRRSVALSPPRICSLGKCENRIDQCLDETGGGIEEKVGNRCLNYSHWNSIIRVYWADW